MTIWATLWFSSLVPVQPHAGQLSVPKHRKVRGTAKGERTFYLLVETVEKTLLVVLSDDLERGGWEKVAHAILNFIWERDADVDVSP